MKAREIIFIAAIPLILVLTTTSGHTQLLKKLTKSAADAAERALNRKVEEKAEKETEAAFDSIFNKNSHNKNVNYGGTTPDREATNERGNTSHTHATERNYEKKPSPNVKVYQKFDFIPGDRIMLYDDFSSDNIGDFPSKWDSNGSGELVTFSGSEEKWFKMVNQSTYIPDLPGELPEEYTIEFDVASVGLDQKTSSTARLKIQLDEEKSFQIGRNRAIVTIPFAQYIDAGIQISNYLEGKKSIYNVIKMDIREQLIEQAHVSVAVNHQRFRLWINEKKVVDVPRLIPKKKISAFKLSISSFTEGKESVFINHVKVADGGLDLRHQLVTEGKFSTSGILFDVNSSTIKPESYPVIKDIAKVLKENPELSIKVVGHTDADGDEETNLTLSKKRAYSVKEFLATEFSIEIGRIDIDGKGEGQPIDSNATTTGKANNRRVEFIKI